MSDPVVYRSADPQVVGAWTGACDALEQYENQTAQILEDSGVGDYTIWRMTGFNKGVIAGIGIPDDEQPPVGWRFMPHKPELLAVPDKRTKAGKAVGRALNDVVHPGLPSNHLPGMPSYAVVAARMLTPGVRLLEDGAAIWVEWTRDPEKADRPGGTVDRAVWSREKLSRLYSEVERQEAAQAAEGATP